ncbi:hypothetical protein [Chroococcidiopsis sp. SAG 2025]|nr:hypothetical protein [Chroococcidiopsis sp. SAG 2025]
MIQTQTSDRQLLVELHGDLPQSLNSKEWTYKLSIAEEFLGKDCP